VNGSSAFASAPWTVISHQTRINLLLFHRPDTRAGEWLAKIRTILEGRGSVVVVANDIQSTVPTCYTRWQRIE
jgi:hypothetical protein